MSVVSNRARPGLHSILVGLAAVVAVGAGCGPSFTPGVFPTSAQLGDTIAIAIDSNNIPYVDHTEKYDLSSENVEIAVSLVGDESCTTTLAPRSVFDAALSKSTQRTFLTGVSATIAVVDLPQTALPCLGGVFPALVSVQLVRDGLPEEFVTGSLTLTGDQGAPTLFQNPAEQPGLAAGESLDERFIAKPGLRLRPLAGDGTAGDPGFAFAWTVASIEFDLEYEDQRVTNPAAFSATDAHHGTAIVGPSTSLGGGRSLAHVVVMDPNGFQLGPLSFLSESDGAGQGPVVELTFDKLFPFAAADFEIRNLVVTQTSGAIEVDLRGESAPYLSDDFFKVVAIAND